MQLGSPVSEVVKDMNSHGGTKRFEVRLPKREILFGYRKSRVLSFRFLIALFAFVSITSSYANPKLTDSEKRQSIDAMYREYKGSFPKVREISPEDAAKRMEERSVLFVDVRDPGERSISMLSGAVTEEAFLDGLESYVGKTVVAYCTIGYRSGKFAERMAKKGIRVLNLKGGILLWVHDGGRVFKDGKPVNRIHVYGKKWALAPEPFESVY